jgi:putative transposase
VYQSFWRWRKEHLWEQIHAKVRAALRVRHGREVQPRAGIIESQSVKTTGVGGARGQDGAKKIKGRKRHLLVDTQGFVLTVQVHPADGMDRDGVPLLRPPAQTKAQFPRLTHGWLDAGSNGRGKGKDWTEKTLGWTTTTVRPPARRVLVLEEREPAPRPAFMDFPRRGVGEQPLAWWGQSRRLSPEDERWCGSSEAMISAAMRRLRVRRVAAA